MATQYELDDMAGKHPRPTVEDVSQSSDQDHLDSAQLAKLGKKAVLKVSVHYYNLHLSCADISYSETSVVGRSWALVVLFLSPGRELS
jgi:hypothetical protein